MAEFAMVERILPVMIVPPLALTAAGSIWGTSRDWRAAVKATFRSGSALTEIRCFVAHTSV